MLLRSVCKAVLLCSISKYHSSFKHTIGHTNKIFIMQFTTACSVSGRVHTRIRSVCVGLLKATAAKTWITSPPPSLSLSLTPSPHLFFLSLQSP